MTLNKRPARRGRLDPEKRRLETEQKIAKALERAFATAVRTLSASDVGMWLIHLDRATVLRVVVKTKMGNLIAIEAPKPKRGAKLAKQ